MKIFDRLNRSGVKHAVYGYGVKLWVKVGYNVHIILQRLDRKPLHSRRKLGRVGQSRLAYVYTLACKLGKLLYAVVIPLYCVPCGFIHLTRYGQRKYALKRPHRVLCINAVKAVFKADFRYCGVVLRYSVKLGLYYLNAVGVIPRAERLAGVRLADRRYGRIGKN